MKKLFIVLLFLAAIPSMATTWKTELIHSEVITMPSGTYTNTSTKYLSTMFDTKSSEDSLVTVAELSMACSDTVVVTRCYVTAYAVPVGYYTKAFLHYGTSNTIDSTGKLLVADSVGATNHYPSLTWISNARGVNRPLITDMSIWQWRPKIVYNIYCVPQATATLTVKIYLIKKTT